MTPSDNAEFGLNALNNTNRCAKVVRLKINTSKTEVMAMQMLHGMEHSMHFGTESLKVPIQVSPRFFYGT